MISMRGISKFYVDDKPALNDVNVEIGSGEFVFIVGHSGSGKSTFIRMLLRELAPSRGQIIVAGQDLGTMRNGKVPYLRRNIGCVFQDFKLLPNKTSFENVAFALEVIGKSKHVIRTQVPEVLRLVGLDDKIDNYPDELSGGEQQRVSIARAFVNRPPLLLCDEPTGNLDTKTGQQIIELFTALNREDGITLVIVTHESRVSGAAHRIVRLEDGRVSAEIGRIGVEGAACSRAEEG
jgi:cell division transport system ATP-binding protein